MAYPHIPNSWGSRVEISEKLTLDATHVYVSFRILSSVFRVRVFDRSFGGPSASAVSFFLFSVSFLLPLLAYVLPLIAIPLWVRPKRKVSVTLGLEVRPVYGLLRISCLW